MLTTEIYLSIFGILLAIFLAWLVWVAGHRAKCKESNSLQVYIDDSKICKVEVFEHKFDWGTRLFPFRKCKLDDIPVSSMLSIKYVPPRGIERDLEKKYYEAIPAKNRLVMPLKLKGRKFFQENAVDKVKVVLLTPFERSKYSVNIKHEIEDNILCIWNENSEQIRNFRLLLDRPIELDGLEVIEGSIDSVDMEIAYPALKSIITKKVGKVKADVAMSLILDLPPRKIDGSERIRIRISD